MANITYRINSSPAIPGSTIVKNSPLTNVEVDANFKALDVDVNLKLAKASNLSDLADTATARTNLGVAIGTNVQAYNDNLTGVAGVASNGLIAKTGTNTAAARTITGTTGYVTVTNGDGVSGNPTITVGANVAKTDTANTFTGYNNFSSTDAIKIPVGTTGERPVSFAQGQLRYNTTLSQFEGYNGTAWGAIGGGGTTLSGGSVLTALKTLTSNATVPSGSNGLMIGPVTVPDGLSISVADGSRLVTL